MTPSVTADISQGHLPPIELFYLDLDKPLLVYQRHGGLVVVPFTLAGGRHVVCVRIDPLDDDETVEIIPSYRRDPGMALEALVEALDATRGATAQARERGHDEAVRLCERAVGAIEVAVQDAADVRYVSRSERRPTLPLADAARRVRPPSTPPVRSRRGARATAGAWPR